MPLNDTALNAMGDHLASLAGFISVHSADPGATGLNEVAVTRQAAVWSGAAAGDLSLSGAENFTGGPAGGACTHVGLWDTAGPGGTFYGGFALTGDLTFNAAGEYSVNDVTIAGTSTG